MHDTPSTACHPLAPRLQLGASYQLTPDAPPRALSAVLVLNRIETRTVSRRTTGPVKERARHAAGRFAGPACQAGAARPPSGAAETALRAAVERAELALFDDNELRRDGLLLIVHAFAPVPASPLRR